jgi:hypothetical protein
MSSRYRIAFLLPTVALGALQEEVKTAGMIRFRMVRIIYCISAGFPAERSLFGNLPNFSWQLLQGLFGIYII